MGDVSEDTGIATQRRKNGVREAIAIVGMACRLPGRVSSPQQLWDLLNRGGSGLGEIPASRFSKEGFYHPNSQRPESISSAAGYFLEDDIRSFDNEFFGINNLEAQYMDPQQRQLLEVTYECCESAGLPLGSVSGKPIGCYVANFTTDFALLQAKDPELFHRYSGTGMGVAILANRISHTFNLKGPSITLDTACSSAVYALHLACTALRNGECDGAFVGGANLIQAPELYMSAVKAGMTSATSACHTFDSAADGYARAEGVGVLYLKRLSDAIRDGDPVRSVIRGTAVNSNGRTNGISLPSVAGQEAVIRQAYANAGLDPDQTDYIEAHGTGTEVGDGIEVEAFSRVIRHRSNRPMLIGGVKTNLGHSEAVSGLTSIMKISLALENALIPPTIGIKTVNPKLRLTERNARIVTINTPWPETSLPRASMNSFGYGGSNGHVILDSAQGHRNARLQDETQGLYNAAVIIPVSGRTDESLKARYEDLDRFRSVMEGKNILKDVAYTLSNRRSHFNHRGFIVSSEASLSDRFYMPEIQTSVLSEGEPLPSLVFVFTGQGAQWNGMGRWLLAQYPLFAQVIDTLDRHLSSISHAPEWKLRDVLTEYDTKGGVHQASIAQPACSAVQIGLLEVLRVLQIKPNVVVGHSSGEINALYTVSEAFRLTREKGEIAAAYAAGYITSKEAIVTAYYRGLAVSAHAPEGAMAALGVDTEVALNMISECGHSDAVWVACINSPSSVTISGECSAIDEIILYADQKRVFARKLKTDNKAYHTHHMVEAGHVYIRLLQNVYQKNPSLRRAPLAKMISSVTGSGIDSNEVASAEYWRQNLQSRVKFSEALTLSLEGRPSVIIEIGPHSALKGPTQDLLKASNRTHCMYTPTMMKCQENDTSLLQLVGKLFLRGIVAPIETLNARSPPAALLNNTSCERRVVPDLPPYSWRRGSILWNEGRASFEYRKRPYPRHDLLGSLIAGGSGQTHTWRNLLRVHDVPWLRDHKLGDTIVFPAAGYMAMAVEAFQQAVAHRSTGYRSIQLQQIKFIQILSFNSETTSVEIFTELCAAPNTLVTPSETKHTFTISSFEAGCSTVHARGIILLGGDVNTRGAADRALPETVGGLSSGQWYRRMFQEGLNFGPKFQCLADIRRVCQEDTHDVVASMAVSDHSEASESRYLMHPTSVDALFQASIISTSAATPHTLRGKIPVSIESANFTFAVGMPEWSRGTIRARSEFASMHTALACSELWSQHGTLLKVKALQIVPWQKYNAGHDVHSPRQPLMEIVWRPDITALNSISSEQLGEVIRTYTRTLEPISNPDIAKLGVLAQFLCHKRPGKLDILHLAPAVEADIWRMADILRPSSSLGSARSYVVGHLQESELVLTNRYGETEVADANALFDVILVSSNTEGKKEILLPLLSHLRSKGKILLRGSSHAICGLAPNFQSHLMIPTSSTSRLMIAGKPTGGEYANLMPSPATVFISSDQLNIFESALKEELLEQVGFPMVTIPLRGVTEDSITHQALIICAVECERSILSAPSEYTMKRIRLLTRKAATIIWLHKANHLGKTDPHFALVSGLSRTLAIEKPSLKFCTLDIGPAATVEGTASNIAFIIDQILHDRLSDVEYAQKEGILHVCRLSPSPVLNRQFNAGMTRIPELRALGKIPRSQLSIKSPGAFKTLCFEALPNGERVLPPTFVEVQVKAVGLNAKDYYALKGKVNTKDATCSLDFTGIVTRVGSSVSGLEIGNRIVGMAPNKFETLVRVPEWTCCKLEHDEDFYTMASVPIAFATALYGLQHRAGLKAGESVLIHSAAGGAGIAAVQIAKLIGARIFATVGTEEKKDFLAKNFGIPRERIFSSRNSAFLQSVLRMTNGEGVDVVFNSLIGDLLRASWAACAAFGRFVDISKRDCVDGGLLDMSPFSRGTTYHAFDLAELYHSTTQTHHLIWHGLLEKSVNMVRSGAIRPVQPLKIFDVSHISDAFEHFGVASRMGKVVVSLSDPGSKILYLPPKYRTAFYPDKTYLLVGGLGGLGRSISRWMIERGARHLIFLSRSGGASAVASDHISKLQAEGVGIYVVQGDVSRLEDVQRTLAGLQKPLGGVIHAAMSLSEALFEEMTVEKWNSCLSPKVQGAWNLHQALSTISTDNLDFFLMTSSIAGSVGLATESNYCAANAFLDALARHRRSLGLPAVSVALGCIAEVGYLYDHPEIERMLLRKGIMSYGEEEMIQIIDIALSTTGGASDDDAFVNGHIISGLELEGLRRMREAGSEDVGGIFDDPRLGILVNARALEAPNQDHELEVSRGETPAGQKDCLGKAVADVCAGVAGSYERLDKLVQAMLRKSLASLLLLPVERVQANGRLAEYGIDSMLGAELRTALFKQFDVDVPLSVLLEERLGLGHLALFVSKALLGK